LKSVPELQKNAGKVPALPIKAAGDGGLFLHFTSSKIFRITYRLTCNKSVFA
jgi:hypothetical protein